MLKRQIELDKFVTLLVFLILGVMLGIFIHSSSPSISYSEFDSLLGDFGLIGEVSAESNDPFSQIVPISPGCDSIQEYYEDALPLNARVLRAYQNAVLNLQDHSAMQNEILSAAIEFQSIATPECALGITQDLLLSYQTFFSSISALSGTEENQTDRDNFTTEADRAFWMNGFAFGRLVELGINPGIENSQEF